MSNGSFLQTILTEYNVSWLYTYHNVVYNDTIYLFMPLIATINYPVCYIGCKFALLKLYQPYIVTLAFIQGVYNKMLPISFDS
jgi:hypothetical protein